MGNGKGHGILSPAGSSFPALSTASHSPVAWADQYIVKSPQEAIAGPSTSASQGHHSHHQRQDSALIAKKLFEDDERSALDDFFNKTLDEAGKPENVIVKEAPTSLAESAATSSSGGDNVTEGPSSTVASEQRKRTRKQPETSKPIATKTSRVKRSVTGKSQKKEAAVIAKVEEKTKDEEALEDSQIPAKRVRTDSLIKAESIAMVDAAASSSNIGPGKRTSHIASEQKRRSTIKDNYKTLVDLLLAGEATSGISLLGGAEEEEEEAESGTKKSKPKGRGRGRKGQDGAGATKSVVLERAADYLRWLDKGNDDLEKEIARLEGILAK